MSPCPFYACLYGEDRKWAVHVGAGFFQFTMLQFHSLLLQGLAKDARLGSILHHQSHIPIVFSESRA